ncbi:hypothetical protein G7047_27580 [Diaphorobacter sp. HDW4A]|uniref:hypothetical protein n=1 Tax=Diaphorobacter sp. HDW4A TaxID=2714924 RepID=UPI00140B6B8E|nr:hypothetical protein [Diaphorobacter sp. HDW4A]QIL83284.1 hypothetical protein G7047_27580 [Diaphorobacter sp. HDW4A]
MHQAVDGAGEFDTVSDLAADPNLTDAERANGTREGYVEIINMADLPRSTSGVYPLIDMKNGRAQCADKDSNLSWSTLNRPASPDAATATALGLAPPTTGLTANWTLINVPKALSWSGAAMALEARKNGTPAKGNIVYFSQTGSAGATDADLSAYSADPLFGGTTPAIRPAPNDLPDLSTPYVVGMDSPGKQVAAIADALAVEAVVNEFWTTELIHAETDWLFSMPTRRFALGVNYQEADPGKATVYNTAVNSHFASKNMFSNGDARCFTNPQPYPRDREGGTGVGPDDVVIGTPSPYPPQVLCGATSMLSFNNTESVASNVLSSRIALNHFDTRGPADGWARINVPGSTGVGIPVIGHAFVKAFNPAVAPGVAGNFGVSWPHRLLKK